MRADRFAPGACGAALAGGPVFAQSSLDLGARKDLLLAIIQELIVDGRGGQGQRSLGHRIKPLAVMGNVKIIGHAAAPLNSSSPTRDTARRREG